MGTHLVPAGSGDRRLRLWYWIVMSKAKQRFARVLPIPPMPMMPSSFPCGSWPSPLSDFSTNDSYCQLDSKDVPVFPFHSPWRIASDGTHDRRNAPSIKYIATSAVASSTAPGVLEMRIPANKSSAMVL